MTTLSKLGLHVHWIVLLTALTFFCADGVANHPQDRDPQPETGIEFVQDPRDHGDGLGTQEYQPSKLEKVYFEKLTPEQIRTGGLAGDYNIAAHTGKYVGWFGIVRSIVEDKLKNKTTLIIEHKYFDGFTDLHQQVISFNGSGDFKAELAGTDFYIDDLCLIKVYGVASKADNGLPVLKAEFAKCWAWGCFAFIGAHGEQRGSDQWRKLNTVPLDGIYDRRPDESYYVKRLGPNQAIKQRLKIDKLARQCAMAMGSDTSKLLKRSGKFVPLIDRDEFRRRAMTAALQLQPDSKVHIKEIVTAICDEDYERLNPKIELALEEGFHDAVAAVLVHALVLDDEDDTAATNYLPELSFSASKFIPDLIEALRCEDSWSRRVAAEVLGSIGPEAETAIPSLMLLLANSGVYDRELAIESLGKIAKQPEFVVPALIIVMDDFDDSIRFSTADALGNFGLAAKSAAPKLADAVKRDGDDRWHSAERLGRVGDPKIAVPVLIHALADRDNNVRRFAAMGLGHLGTSAAQASIPLKKLLSDTEVGVRIAAAEALWLIEENSVDTLPVLGRALSSNHFGPVMWSGDALQRFGPKALPVLDSLLAATKHKVDYARIAAVHAIAKIGPEARAALPRVRELTNDESVEVRAFAIAALWTINNEKEAISMLIKELKSEATKNDRNSVIDALGLIGESGKAAVPLVRQHLSHQSEFTRQAAGNYLKTVDAPKK